MHRFKLSSPNTTVIFSEIVSRLSWLFSPQRRAMEKIRKRINRAMEKYLPSLEGFSYRHIELGGLQGLYRQHGIHLSDVGLDVFNLGLQSCIDMAAGMGKAGVFL